MVIAAVPEGMLPKAWWIFQNNIPLLWYGIKITLMLAVLGTFFGLLIGLVLGGVRAVKIEPRDRMPIRIVKRILHSIVAVYVWFFRGTPMMVQAMVIYYGLKTSGVNISPFAASIVVLTLNTGAYMAETVRGGIISVDKGQLEGGFAMGMSHTLTMFTVVLPQAFRNIIPEMVNMFLTNLKMTSELNVIGVAELYFTTKTAAGTYYRYFESYIICAIIYLILCTIFTKALSTIEKKAFAPKDYELAVEYSSTAE